MPLSSPSTSEPKRAFGALAVPGYVPYLLTFMLTMMADNVEHVISYWVCYQKFHSAALGGFAVVSHWLPFLLFSVPVGALNDRFDSRRIIQAGGLCFALASAGWGYFFVTDSLEMWHAMLLLVLHGCAGVMWITSSQMLLYDIVGAGELPSAVRVAATGRYLGVLVGPMVGSAVMLTLGVTNGIFFNTLFYVPLLVWLIGAPYGRHFRKGAVVERQRVRGLEDILATVREVRLIPVLISMIALAGAASFFIGNSYQAQMPGFAQDLGHGDPGASYSMLLAADAAGALLAGILLESRGGIFAMKPSIAIRLAMSWAAALGAFALIHSYPLALATLFLAGFFELSFSSMLQTLVQVNAPEATRGKVLGLYNMAWSGFRAFSGVTVGLAGSVYGIHVSLSVACAAFFVVAGALVFVVNRATASAAT